jgi:hypothetical protein
MLTHHGAVIVLDNPQLRIYRLCKSIIEVILNGKLFCERARDKINFEKLK